MKIIKIKISYIYNSFCEIENLVQVDAFLKIYLNLHENAILLNYNHDNMNIMIESQIEAQIESVVEISLLPFQMLESSCSQFLSIDSFFISAFQDSFKSSPLYNASPF